MQAMAKMANMAKDWERVGGIKEFPLRVAISAKKFLDKKFLVFSLIRRQRGSLKVAIFTEIASLAKMAYSWQNLANIPYQIQQCFECIFKLFLKTVFNLFCEIGFK